jgi:hypothetical protein
MKLWWMNCNGAVIEGNSETSWPDREDKSQSKSQAAIVVWLFLLNYLHQTKASKSQIGTLVKKHLTLA